MENVNNIYSFEQPYIELKVTNYIDKVAIVLLIIAFIGDTFFLHNIKELSSLILPFAILSLLSLFLEWYKRRVAHQIIFDLNKKEITFLLYQNRSSVVAKIEDIEHIHIGYYIKFILKKRNVFYNDVVNKDLMAFLEGLRPTTWNRIGRFMCKYW